MPSQNEIDDQLELLATHRRNLALYLRQQANVGSVHVTVGISNGIYEERNHIRRIKNILRDWSVVIEDHPDDEEHINQPDVDISANTTLEGKQENQEVPPALSQATNLLPQNEPEIKKRKSSLSDKKIESYRGFLNDYRRIVRTSRDYRDIVDARSSIARIKKILRDNGIYVEDKTEDNTYDRRKEDVKPKDDFQPKVTETVLPINEGVVNKDTKDETNTPWRDNINTVSNPPFLPNKNMLGAALQIVRVMALYLFLALGALILLIIIYLLGPSDTITLLKNLMRVIPAICKYMKESC